MYSITKDFAFSASHRLKGLDPGHQCGRLHGHNYQVRVQLVAPLLDHHGFVFDYGDLAPFKTWIDTTVDHQDLNQVWPELGNPTAENLARHLQAVVVRVCKVEDTVTVSVGVSETPKTWAWYVP